MKIRSAIWFASALFCLAFCADHLLGSDRVRPDFATFYFACKAVANQQAIYGAASLSSLALESNYTGHVTPYLYPPIFPVVASFLGRWPLELANSIWVFASALFYIVVVAAVVLTAVHQYGPRPVSSRSGIGRPEFTILALCLVAFLALPFRGNLLVGQINFMVLAFIASCFFLYFTGKSELSAGVFLGLAAAIKVTPALLLAFFIARRRYRALLGCLLSIAALTGVSLLPGGMPYWEHFFDFLPSMYYGGAVEGLGLAHGISNISTAGFFLRLLPDAGFVVYVYTATVNAVLFGYLFVRSYRARDAVGEQLLLLPYLVLMIIFSPLAYEHHLVYLYPGVAFLFCYIWFSRTGMARIVPVVTLLLLLFIESHLIWLVYLQEWFPMFTQHVIMVINTCLLFLVFLMGIALFRFHGDERAVTVRVPENHAS
jgi:alpha-1,2-mannosyltransferase